MRETDGRMAAREGFICGLITHNVESCQWFVATARIIKAKRFAQVSIRSEKTAALLWLHPSTVCIISFRVDTDPPEFPMAGWPTLSRVVCKRSNIPG